MSATISDPFGAVPGSDDFVITHMFDAPRDMVWAAHTQSEHLSHWWGPEGLTVRVADVDLRPGGLFRYGLQVPDGEAMWGRWLFRSIIAPSRIVVVVSFTDEAGQPTKHPMEPNWPLGMLCSMTMEQQGNRTLLTLVARPDEAATGIERQTFAAGHDNMKQGFGGTFAKLDAYLTTLMRP